LTASTWTDATDLNPAAVRTLRIAAQAWFGVAIAGQCIFLAYVIAFYGAPAMQGNFAAWNKGIPHAYAPGATMSNVAAATHLLMAVVIMLGGPLQLVPQIRRYAPSFHRWNGRLYLLAVFATSLAGLYMVWSRLRPAHFFEHVGISVDAVLIMSFAVVAVRYAIARDIRKHQRWALRLFMVVNAGWFFRVILMFWLLINQGPVGFDAKTFTGPFLVFLSFADYLLPLAILEVYFRTRDRGQVRSRFAMAAVLVVLTIATVIGIFAASMVLWLPRMRPEPGLSRTTAAVMTNTSSKGHPR
jgi:hypothetical protein